jgi:hypothetical protein
LISPKVRIYKSSGKWFVEYKYNPRSFTLFGANKHERAEIYDRAIDTVECKDWLTCIRVTTSLYRERIIRF